MLKANAYCNQLGIDVDAAGGAISWAMECYQRGILHEADTDGLRLVWGDADVALEMIRRICYRKGFGDVLAEGCARAADIVGRDSGYYARDDPKEGSGPQIQQPLPGPHVQPAFTSVQAPH